MLTLYSTKVLRLCLIIYFSYSYIIVHELLLSTNYSLRGVNLKTKIRRCLKSTFYLIFVHLPYFLCFWFLICIPLVDFVEACFGITWSIICFFLLLALEGTTYPLLKQCKYTCNLVTQVNELSKYKKFILFFVQIVCAVLVIMQIYGFINLSKLGL